MLSIIDIKKTIKQHTADMDITDSVDYKISAPPRFYNISTLSVIPGDSDWYSRPYIFFVLRKKYSKPYIFVNRL
jgi:hypothetical protein